MEFCTNNKRVKIIFTYVLTIKFCTYKLLRPSNKHVDQHMTKTSVSNSFLSIVMLFFSSLSFASTDDTTSEPMTKYPYIFHLVQKHLWEETLASNGTYYPPTYTQDEFTHATANPDFLLIIGNHFYKDVKGDWLCLRMSVDTLKATDVKTIFEGTAPVGDKQPDFPGTDSELFPHILGGISPAAVLQAHTVSRADDGTFLSVSEIIIGK
jgi:uncharacterized protein (DUF952 family)